MVTSNMTRNQARTLKIGDMVRIVGFFRTGEIGFVEQPGTGRYAEVRVSITGVLNWFAAKEIERVT